MTNQKIGIIGVGWIGKQFKRYFEEIKNHKRGVDLFLYDTDIKKNFTDDITQAEIVFICLPTPRNPKDGACDISIVEDGVQRAIANGGQKIIVIKSTVVPGTTEYFQDKHPKHKFLFNPEFLTESKAWEDMLRPDRQIIGFTKNSLDAAHLVLSLLPKAPFMSPWGVGTYNKIRITATEAEFIKYAANVHFVRKVNWANSLALAAEKLGADYENIRKGMSADHRIGDSHLDVNHGGYFGWGGYCFPKDLDAFIQFSNTANLKNIVDLLKADRFFNEALLRGQGLLLNDVSCHTNKLTEKLDKKSRAFSRLRETRDTDGQEKERDNKNL